LNAHAVNGFRQTGVHIAEPLVPEPIAFDVQMAMKKLKDINNQVLISFQQK
jgi:hypothetical protein